MHRLMMLGALALGGWLLFEEKPKPKVVLPPEPKMVEPKPVTKEEMRRVMSLLGKRSGRVRAGRL